MPEINFCLKSEVSFYFYFLKILKADCFNNCQFVTNHVGSNIKILSAECCVQNISSVQYLAWLKAIAEDNLGVKRENKHVCEGLDQGLANWEQIQPIPEVFILDK